MRRIRNRFNELLAIKSRQEKKKFTQRMVIEATGLSQQTITLYSTNRITRYDEDTLIALCDFLGCKVNDLLVEEDEEPQPRRHELAMAAV